MKTTFKTILIAMLALTMYGCSKDDNNPPKEEPTAVLTGISPDSGPKNTVVTIKGDNFGTDASKIKIYFNEVEAAVQAVTNIQITTSVPPRSGGPITVIINGKELPEQEFMYLNSEWIVSTFAGSGQGEADGPATAAQFDNPNGIIFDADGNMYVADTNNNKIRKITPEGEVTTFVGSNEGNGDGTGENAQFHNPRGIAIDAQGNLYVADATNHSIRKITPNAQVTTLAGGSTPGSADGTGSAAQFFYPTDLEVDENGNVYVADSNNHKIRKITPNGEVTTFAGSTEGYMDGSGSIAQFAEPQGIAIDVRGNLLVVDSDNSKIRKISTTGEVTTIAGSTAGFADGAALAAQFSFPFGIEADTQGNMYVVDTGNDKIRKISTTGEVSTLAGSTQGFGDGTGATAKFSNPFGVALDSEGHIYIGDQSNHRIRLLIWE